MSLPSFSTPSFDTPNWLPLSLSKRRSDFVNLRSIRVIVGTWNVGGSIPSSCFRPWIFGHHPSSISSANTFPHITPLLSRPLPATPPPPNSDTVSSSPSPTTGDSPSFTTSTAIPSPPSPTCPPPLPPRPPPSVTTSATSSHLYPFNSPPAHIISLGFQEVDTSTDVYLAHDPSTLTNLRDKLMSALGPVYDSQYTIVSARQLIGIALIVAVHNSLLPSVHDIKWASVGCGIMGILGNKGAVACQMRIADSCVCIVNSHLAADVDQVARRNADFHEIRRRLWFRPESSFDTHNDSAYNEDDAIVIWMGDLNYRLTRLHQHVMAMINNKQFDSLLLNDQLKQVMVRGDAFAGFFEAPIQFPPTYKYDVGLNQYDTSEKRRTPAWCDRILWRLPPLGPESVKPSRYTCHQDYVDSDHRPVSIELNVQIAEIIPEKLDIVTREILREHDKWENDLIPEASVDPPVINLGSIFFLRESSTSCILTNVGRTSFTWEFTCPPTSNAMAEEVNPSLSKICFSWCNPEPTCGSLEPGACQTIKFIAYPMAHHAEQFNLLPKDELAIIFVLHLRNGCDFFLSLEGQWQRTILAQNLTTLCQARGPARSWFPALEPNSPSINCEYGAPPELVVIAQYMQNHGKLNLISIRDTIVNHVDDELVQEIIDALDTTQTLDHVVPNERYSSKDIYRAVFRTLIMILEYLPISLVPPGDLQDRMINLAVSGSDDLLDKEAINRMMEMVSELPTIHRSTLVLVLEICQILISSEHQELTPENDSSANILEAEKLLTEVFGPLALRNSSTLVSIGTCNSPYGSRDQMSVVTENVRDVKKQTKSKNGMEVCRQVFSLMLRGVRGGGNDRYQTYTDIKVMY